MRIAPSTLTLTLMVTTIWACQTRTPAAPADATAPSAVAALDPAHRAQPAARATPQPATPQPAPPVAPSPPAPSPQAAQRGPTYSPFVLEVKSQSVFKRISFKDVGAKLAQEQASLVYESLAEALSMELAQRPTLKMSAEVAFDESITDPTNHLACGSDHLYIDFWRGQNPARWGYSLWSGCGEDDNFAWKELKSAALERPELTEPTEQVAPLARDIVETLAQAAQRGCYQKAC